MIFQGRKLTISIGTARIWPAQILRGERATGHKRISLKVAQIYNYVCECQSCCSSQCDPWGRSRLPCIESPCKSRLCHTGAGLHIIISTHNRNIILFARKRPSRSPKMLIQTCFNIVCARVNTAAWSSLALSTWTISRHFHSSIFFAHLVSQSDRGVILGLSRIDDLSNWQSESLLQDSPPKLEDAPPKLEVPPKPGLDTDPPKPDELWPRDPNENPPPPPRPPAPSKGLRLVSGEQPSARGSPVCPGGQEHSTCPSPLF